MGAVDILTFALCYSRSKNQCLCLSKKKLQPKRLSSMWEDSEFLGMVTDASIARYEIIPLGFWSIKSIKSHRKTCGPIGVDIYITA